MLYCHKALVHVDWRPFAPLSKSDKSAKRNATVTETALTAPVGTAFHCADEGDWIVLSLLQYQVLVAEAQKQLEALPEPLLYEKKIGGEIRALCIFRQKRVSFLPLRLFPLLLCGINVFEYIVIDPTEKFR